MAQPHRRWCTTPSAQRYSHASEPGAVRPRAACDLVHAVRHRAHHQARARHRHVHGGRVDHPGDGLHRHRADRLLSVLGARGRALSRRLFRLRQRHRLVPVLGAAARRDRDALGRRAPARLHGDAADRNHLSADPDGPHRHRFPPHLHRAVRRRAPRHHGGGGARAHRGVPRPDRQQRRPRHVPRAHLHRQHLRQDDHRRRRLDHRARADREGRRRRGAVERLVHRLPAVQHPHRARRMVAHAQDVSAGDGEPRRRPRLPPRRAQEDGTVVGAREKLGRCCSASRWRCGSPISSTTSRRR